MVGSNSFWMLLDQGIRILVGFFVGLYIARSLGPQQLGLLNYALAVMAILMALGRFGMDAILPSRLQSEKSTQELLSRAFILMLLAAAICFLFGLIVVALYDSASEQRVLTLIVLFSVFLQPALVLEYQLQAANRARRSSIIRIVTLLVISVLRLMALNLEGALYWVAFSYVIENMLIAILLFVSHPLERKFSKQDTREIFKLARFAAPVAISSFIVLLYMKLDILIVTWVLGGHYAGIYSAATKLYEFWVLFPLTVSLSVLPMMTKKYAEGTTEYETYTIRLLSLLMWCGFLVSLVSFLLAKPIILLLYGTQFNDSAEIFSIVMLAAVFNSIGSITARHMVICRLQNLLLLRSCLTVIINVILNLLLIPRFGIQGAAVALVLSSLFGYFLVNILDKRTWCVFSFAWRALALPLYSAKKI